ncbi:formylglycine-generating enzyme family protein [Actinomyces trachealis]|uniref:formylglycine-generating enzyme family protein n=1 Tax=Actinomyces trachealis TaxID=2763540 RepID=UPI003CC830F2
MVNVSWNDSAAFCAITGTRLLTPEEWDRLCDDQVAKQRQGMRAPALLQYAVFSESPDNRLQRVATKKPNRFGLYDMLGNAWEWCDSTDARQAPTKGGSYFSFAEMCRSSTSVNLPKTYRARDLGFRVCYRRNS